MNEETAELIAQMCTRIGMIMEDVSVVALTAGGAERDDLNAGLDEIDAAARQINALIAAAKAIFS